MPRISLTEHQIHALIEAEGNDLRDADMCSPPWTKADYRECLQRLRVLVAALPDESAPPKPSV